MLRTSRATTKITLEDLEERFPSVSRSECQRFLRSFPRTATDRLQACVEFRHRHGLGVVAGNAAVDSQGLCAKEAEEDDRDTESQYPEHQPQPQPQCTQVGNGDDDDGGGDDAKDWRRASDAAIEQHVRQSVADSAMARSGGAIRSARRRLLTAVGVSGGVGDNALLNRRARRDRGQASPLYATGIPQLLYSHTVKAVLNEAQSDKPIDSAGVGRRQLPPPIQDTTEHCVVHFLPALIDLAAFDDPSPSLPLSSGPTPTCKASHTFATAIALYLHAKFDQQQRQCRWRRRQQQEPPSLHANPPTTPEEIADDPQWTLVMDVRPGHGWPNPPAVKMLGFIREAGQMLFELFPGRLHQCIVFPVPAVAASVWGAAKKVLDPTVASRVVVVSGPAEIDSPVPVAKLMPYVSRENLQMMEGARLAAFAE